MTMKLNRSAYEQLVREDIAWLEQQPRTLEREHTIGILKDSPALYYDADELADTALRIVDRDGNTVEPSGDIADVRRLAAAVHARTSTWRQPAHLSTPGGVDAQHLSDMHEMVAQLCEKLGSKRSEAPCDIWHLHDLVMDLNNNATELAMVATTVDNELKPMLNWTRARELARKILRWTEAAPPEFVQLNFRCTCGAADALSDLHDPQCVLAQARQVPMKIHFKP